MALANVQIAWGSARNNGAGASLRGEPSSSEAPATGVVSVTSAPQQQGNSPIVTISAAVPIYYSIGPAPDATVVAKRGYFDPTLGQGLDVFCNPGDKFMWVAA